MPTSIRHVCWKPVKLRLLPHASMKEDEVAALVYGEQVSTALYMVSISVRSRIVVGRLAASIVMVSIEMLPTVRRACL